VHEARAQYDSARASVITSRNDLKDAYEALTEITGQPINNLKALPDDFRPVLPTDYDAEGWVNTAVSTNPALKSLAPVQLTCNYITLFFRNVASLLSEGDSNGTWQRFIVIVTPQGPNSEGGPSSAPADGPTTDNHLHTNPYPNVGAPGQPNECEAANEKYLAGQNVIGNVPGNQGTNHDQTKRDLNQ